MSSVHASISALRSRRPCFCRSSSIGAPFEGAGGILGLVGILALGRFALAAAALDTGSPFGGMGSSREMTIAALAEPALMLGLFTAALSAGSLELGEIVRSGLGLGLVFRPSDVFALAGLFVVLIAETGRIPVDNPATHLELTMIHEAMVLEYAGPDLALVEWASALKELLYITVLIDAVRAARHRHDAGAGASPDRAGGVGGEAVRVRRCDHAGREHQCQAAVVPGARARRRVARPRIPRAGDSLPVRAAS